jgi:hypothetical protein
MRDDRILPLGFDHLGDADRPEAANVHDQESQLALSLVDFSTNPPSEWDLQTFFNRPEGRLTFHLDGIPNPFVALHDVQLSLVVFCIWAQISRSERLTNNLPLPYKCKTPYGRRVVGVEDGPRKKKSQIRVSPNQSLRRQLLFL